MPKTRKKTVARKSAKRPAKKVARKKTASKKTASHLTIEKNLGASLKKAIASAKRDTKKATAVCTAAQKKVSAAEKKQNSAQTKHDVIEKKLAVKSTPTARKALTKAKKTVAKAQADVKKLQKTCDTHAQAANNAKCREERLNGLAKAIAKFGSDWDKQEKSTQHQTDFHTTKKAPKAAKVKKVTRAAVVTTPASLQSNQNAPLSHEDSSAF